MYVSKYSTLKYENQMDLNQYLPRVNTMGHMQSLVKDIVKLLLITGLKFKRRG
jgi:hypothetical protein